MLRLMMYYIHSNLERIQYTYLSSRAELLCALSESSHSSGCYLYFMGCVTWGVHEHRSHFGQHLLPELKQNRAVAVVVGEQGIYCQYLHHTQVQCPQEPCCQRVDVKTCSTTCFDIYPLLCVVIRTRQVKVLGSTNIIST